ncbi:MAG: hypothetical protein JO252_29665, partial [Planctomycetaceae bacterium]|nr:hypothetical protein [Planctomycetaceae bacterium]
PVGVGSHRDQLLRRGHSGGRLRIDGEGWRDLAGRLRFRRRLLQGRWCVLKCRLGHRHAAAQCQEQS